MSARDKICDREALRTGAAAVEMDLCSRSSVCEIDCRGVLQSIT